MTKIKSLTMKFKIQYDREKKYLKKKNSIEKLYKKLEKPVKRTAFVNSLIEIWRQ